MFSLRKLAGGRLTLASLLTLLSGCAMVSPRFSQEVAASFARDDMRRLETADAEIYYPAHARPSAERIAARLEECLGKLRELPKTQQDRGKALVFLTSANFNNAYVSPAQLGEPLHTLLPLRMTVEQFAFFNLAAASVGDVACHELVHYVQMEQTNGLWRGLSGFFGNTLSPNAYLDSWFLEGIAQYYEGRLGKSVGRPNSAFYRGTFESGVAARAGKLEPGDLHVLKRELYPFRGNYLTGMFFVEYLVRVYGEDKLWELVDLQGHSVAPPLIVTLRFRAVYGKSIGALLEDYSDGLAASLAGRTRPESQRVLAPDLGYFVRLAGSMTDGAIAALSVGRDQATQLAIHERDGSLRFSRPLTQFAPGRRWISSGPLQTSGLSFTADGRWLYLMNDDVTEVGASQAQLWKVDAQDGEVVQIWGDLPGNGGCIHPQGGRYLFVEVQGDTSNLVELDLASNERRSLTAFEGTSSLGAPAYSPDGTRVAFSRFGERGFDLYLRAADGSLTQLTQDEAFNYQPRWVDDDHLLFAREREGRVQAYTLELSSGHLGAVSNAPYVVLDPVPIGGGDFAFANRDGWSWSLDAAPLEVVDDWLTQLNPVAVGRSEEPRPPGGPALKVEAEGPYSPVDHLFLPTLHAPGILVFPMVEETGALSFIEQFFLSLKGQDRLGFHQWAVNLMLTVPSLDNSVSLAYGNQLLAPWFARLHLDRSKLGRDTHLSGSIDFSRTFWTTPLTFSLSALDLTRAATEAEPERHARLVGPGAFFDYFAGEGTAHAGTQRALGFSGGVSFYPEPLGSDFGMTDLGVGVTLAPRLPLLARHSLIARIRGRALWGAPEGLLRVGGTPHGDVLAAANASPGQPAPDVFLPGIAFAESLRGYEDYSVRATQVALATVRYRYPFIIDRGWASTLYLLPALFIRQVDFEAFGSMAYTDNPTSPTMRAAGAAVYLRSALSYVPFSLYYQVSARFDAGLAPLHLLGLSFE